MSDTLKLVGQLIDETAQRDAVHVAVAPVISGGNYRPGERVGFMPDGRVGIRVDKLIGVIDPFLESSVREDERCWLFLFPGTITSLRHHWTHPAFSPQPVQEGNSEAEQWLRAFALMNEAEYGEMIEAAINGTEYCFGSDDGPENARGHEFWHHLEKLTGREFSESHRDSVPFRCAC